MIELDEFIEDRLVHLAFIELGNASQTIGGTFIFPFGKQPLGALEEQEWIAEDTQGW